MCCSTHLSLTKHERNDAFPEFPATAPCFGSGSKGNTSEVENQSITPLENSQFAMENRPYRDDLPMKTGAFQLLCQMTLEWFLIQLHR